MNCEDYFVAAWLTKFSLFKILEIYLLSFNSSAVTWDDFLSS